MTTINFKYESAQVSLNIQSDNEANLYGLFSADRQKGHASEVMKKAIKYADKYKLKLHLMVSRYHYHDDIALTDTQLIEFYKKFGFVSIDHEWKVLMIRPRSQELQGL